MLLSKVRRFLRKYKILIKIIVLLIIIIVIALFAYKLLFYSSDEKSVYGVRLDSNYEKISSKEEKEYIEKITQFNGINKVDINIKGRLIKCFINVDNGISKDDIKNKLNETVAVFSENVRSYYDITLYVKQVVTVEDGKEEEKNVIIGYKHKNKTAITFTEL